MLSILLGGAKFMIGEMRHAITVSIVDLNERKQSTLIRVTEAEAAYSKRLAIVSTNDAYRIGFISDKNPVFVRSSVETALVSR